MASCSTCESLMATAERGSDKKKVVGVAIGLGLLAGIVILATRNS